LLKLADAVTLAVTPDEVGAAVTFDARADIALAAVFVECSVVWARLIFQGQFALALAGILVPVEVWLAANGEAWVWLAPSLVVGCVLADIRILLAQCVASRQDRADLFLGCLEVAGNTIESDSCAAGRLTAAVSAVAIVSCGHGLIHVAYRAFLSMYRSSHAGYWYEISLS